MSEHWTTRYVGLPYRAGGRERDGLDCWGLIRLYYREEKAITLPMLPGIIDEGALGVAHEIAQQQTQGRWIEIALPMEGCAVAMSQRTVLHHVGIWTAADGGKVVHAWDRRPVVADTIKGLRLKGIQIVRFFFYGLHHRNSQ